MRAEFVSMAFGISLGAIQVRNDQSKGVRETYIKRVKQEGCQPLSFTDCKEKKAGKNQREERSTEGRTTLSPTLPGTDIQRVHLREFPNFFFQLFSLFIT